MNRRRFLRTATGSALGVALAGCLVSDEDGASTSEGGATTTDDATAGTDATTGDGTTVGSTTTASPDLSGTLTVATYSSFFNAPSSSPGAWVKEEFEKQYPEATVKYTAPESGVNYYIQRKRQGAGIDADVYVGLNAGELVRIDEKLPNRRLFRKTGTDRVPNASHVKPDLQIDPKGRAIPYDTGYISLVYDENEVSNPGTFDALTRDRYAGTLLAQNAQTSDTGRAFLLWTVKTLGEGAYLDYWKRLVDNDTRILKNWDAAYSAYSNGERPIVVSYSTDQVYANRYDQDMSKHQVGFLNDQGYANPETMAAFAGADEPDLADAFMDFLLSKRVQSKIPVLNVQFPATDHAAPPKSFSEYAYEPPEAVTFTYDELQGNVERWIDEWARRVASR
jgi:thiamine transport system substrate-binding protein